MHRPLRTAPACHLSLPVVSFSCSFLSPVVSPLMSFSPPVVSPPVSLSGVISLQVSSPLLSAALPSISLLSVPLRRAALQQPFSLGSLPRPPAGPRGHVSPHSLTTASDLVPCLKGTRRSPSPLLSGLGWDPPQGSVLGAPWWPRPGALLHK